MDNDANTIYNVTDVRDTNNYFKENNTVLYFRLCCSSAI